MLKNYRLINSKHQTDKHNTKENTNNRTTIRIQQIHTKNTDNTTILGLNNAKIQQTLMTTAQNIAKIHNIEQTNNKKTINPN